MKKKIWIIGILAVAVCMVNGCSITEYGARHAAASLEKYVPGTSQADKEEEQAELLEESQNHLLEKEESLSKSSEPTKILEESTEESTEQSSEEEEKQQPIMLGSTAETDEGQSENQEETISYQTKYVINCKKSITLRDRPSASAAQLEEIMLGEPVSFIKDDIDGFSKIVYQGKTGYVLAAYLGDTAPTVNDTAYYTMRVVNCQESISLRQSPSITAAEICQIPLGAIVSYVDSAADGFYEISYLGKNGYALASYLEFYSAADKEKSLPEKVSGTASWVEVNYYVENDRECADVIGYNEQNQKIWQYDARSSHGVTELDSIQEIGVVDDVYYLNEDGTIIALSLGDGRVLWKNSDFGGASIAYDFDEEGTLYICGYYGPDLFAVDRKGNTLINVQSLSPNIQWPYELRYENRAVYITCSLEGMEEIVVQYDLATGGISW